jgi:hypothetical protein
MLPPDLRVVTGRPKTYPETAEPHAEPPTLRWDPAEDAERYIAQLSVGGFRNIAVSTDWHKITLETPEFRIPGWAWAIAEGSETVHWHSLPVLPLERRLVSLDGVCRLPGVAGEPSNGA